MIDGLLFMISTIIFNNGTFGNTTEVEENIHVRDLGRQAGSSWTLGDVYLNDCR